MVNEGKKELELEIVMGIVTRYWAPSPKGEGSGWKPAKLVIETDDGSIDLVEWPKKHYETKIVIEPIKLPQFDRLSLDDIEGKTIKALAVADGEYQGRAQWVVNTNGYTKVVGGDPKPEPTDDEEDPTPAPIRKVSPTPPSIDQEKLRIMRQSTLHYASILIAPIVKDFATPQTMVKRTIEVAGQLLEYVISGEMPSFEDSTEEPEEEASLGVLSANGGGE